MPTHFSPAATSPKLEMTPTKRPLESTTVHLSERQEPVFFPSPPLPSEKHTMGDRMLGSQCILALKQLVPSTAVLEKIYHLNAARILKIKTT